MLTVLVSSSIIAPRDLTVPKGSVKSMGLLLSSTLACLTTMSIAAPAFSFCLKRWVINQCLTSWRCILPDSPRSCLSVLRRFKQRLIITMKLLSSFAFGGDCLSDLTVNVPLHDLVELYNAVNEYDARSKSLDQMRREIEGLRSMMSEIMMLIGELRKSR